MTHAYMLFFMLSTTMLYSSVPHSSVLQYFLHILSPRTAIHSPCFQVITFTCQNTILPLIFLNKRSMSELLLHVLWVFSLYRLKNIVKINLHFSYILCASNWNVLEAQTLTTSIMSLWKFCLWTKRILIKITHLFLP